MAGVEEVELMGEEVDERERTRGWESMLFILDEVVELSFK